MGEETIERFGRLLYGDRWQTELARDMGVNDRTVRRWHSGETPVPDGVWGEIHALVQDRKAEFEEAESDLHHMRAPRM